MKRQATTTEQKRPKSRVEDPFAPPLSLEEKLKAVALAEAQRMRDVFKARYKPLRGKKAAKMPENA